MFVDYLLSNFEIFIFFSICLLVIGFFLIFFFQNLKFQNNKDAITAYADVINKNNKEIKEYIIVVGNLLEHQKKELRGDRMIRKDTFFLDQNASFLFDHKELSIDHIKAPV